MVYLVFWESWEKDKLLCWGSSRGHVVTSDITFNRSLAELRPVPFPSNKSSEGKILNLLKLDRMGSEKSEEKVETRKYILPQIPCKIIPLNGNS